MANTMGIKNNLILGCKDSNLIRSPLFREINGEELVQHYSHTKRPNGRLFLALAQYLKHTNKFDRIFLYVTNQNHIRFPNGTFGGIFGKVNRTEVDIMVNPVEMVENTMETVDFSYPYKIDDFTFITFKPEYRSHIFGIFQTFSLNVWMTLAAAVFAITFLSYFILKYKCNFSKIVFHIFAILMQQTVLIIPSSIAENLLIYSWVIGAMILCLSYNSVFLSFLSFPPLTKIKHLSDLSMAVQKGDYNCIADDKTGVEYYLRSTKQEYLRVIADDISKNSFRYEPLYNNFMRVNKTMNLAFFTQTNHIGLFVGKYFISEDRFFELMAGLPVRRGFCCKEHLDIFVHRIMASGIYFKYFNDFIFSFSSYAGIRENETTNRKLTLIDLAPAFIFLLCGYFLSLFVLILEILSNRRNSRIFKRIRKGSRKDGFSESSV